MSHRYEHLLMPLPVGDRLLKNRMIATAGYPRALGEGDSLMNEKIITHFSNRAKNGAASVYINGGIDMELALNGPRHNQNNYVRQAISAIRQYGSIAVTGVRGSYGTGPHMPMSTPTLDPPTGGRTFTGDPDDMVLPTMPGKGGGTPFGMSGMPAPGGKTLSQADSMTKAEIQEFIDNTVKQAIAMKEMGFEMISVHSAYRTGPGGSFWSPLCNHRTDEYGGSTRNRARLLIELFGAMREALGRDFPLECMVSGAEAGGITVEDTIELARMGKGTFNILHLRHGEQDYQHPIPYTAPENAPCPNLDVSAAIKSAVGDDMLIAISAGLQDPAFCNAIIRDKKADLIGMCRSFICDSEYGKKIYAGRGEDITPCIRCNKCHGPNVSDPIRSQCSVNPVIGIEDKIDRMFPAPEEKKCVGVIGGGPAGMEAAITAAKRGHTVYLFEQSGALGGQLKHADHVSFKWPLRRFKDYLAREVWREGVNVVLNFEATRDNLLPYHLDDLIVAIGPALSIPSIPGAELAAHAIDVFGHEKDYPENCIVIGGGETGLDTGLYLAKTGHKVSVLCRQNNLVSDTPHAHYRTMARGAFVREPNFTDITKVKKYVEITEDGLTYQDAEGQEHFLPGKVIMATGTKAQPEKSATFYGAANQLHFVGDCYRAGDVHNAIYTAFGAASLI